MTHCSACGRKLRAKTMHGQAAPSRSFPRPWTAWLNHRRDCSRYGLDPDVARSAKEMFDDGEPIAAIMAEHDSLDDIGGDYTVMGGGA